jgi:hypothetical protein
VDALSSDVFEVLGRERHGRPMPCVATLPTGLFTADPALVRERLAESDFVCLVTRAPQNWPFDRQMAAMLPEARLWCDAHLKHDADLEDPGFSVSVYERPGMGGPAKGVDLAAMLAAGRTGPAYAAARPPGVPGVHATWDHPLDHKGRLQPRREGCIRAAAVQREWASRGTRD